MMFPVSPLIPQTPGEVYQNTIIPTTVWQHDWRIHFWQPCIWEQSEYRCREHAGCGFTEHQCAVLIPSHLDAIVSSHCSPAEGTASSIPALTISKRWCSILVMFFIITLIKSTFLISECGLISFLNPKCSPCPHVGMKKHHVLHEVISIVEVFDFPCKLWAYVYLCRYFSFN